MKRQGVHCARIFPNTYISGKEPPTLYQPWRRLSSVIWNQRCCIMTQACDKQVSLMSHEPSTVMSSQDSKRNKCFTHCLKSVLTGSVWKICTQSVIWPCAIVGAGRSSADVRVCVVIVSVVEVSFVFDMRQATGISWQLPRRRNRWAPTSPHPR